MKHDTASSADCTEAQGLEEKTLQFPDAWTDWICNLLLRVSVSSCVLCFGLFPLFPSLLWPDSPAIVFLLRCLAVNSLVSVSFPVFCYLSFHIFFQPFWPRLFPVCSPWRSDFLFLAEFTLLCLFVVTLTVQYRLFCIVSGFLLCVSLHVGSPSGSCPFISTPAGTDTWGQSYRRHHLERTFRLSFYSSSTFGQRRFSFTVAHFRKWSNVDSDFVIITSLCYFNVNSIY